MDDKKIELHIDEEKNEIEYQYEQYLKEQLWIEDEEMNNESSV